MWRVSRVSFHCSSGSAGQPRSSSGKIGIMRPLLSVRLAAATELPCWPKCCSGARVKVPQRLCPTLLIACRLVTSHSTPIHRLRRGMRVGETYGHVVVPTVRIRILLMYKSNTAEAIFQACDKILVRQITFYPRVFPVRAIEEKH